MSMSRDGTIEQWKERSGIQYCVKGYVCVATLVLHIRMWTKYSPRPVSSTSIQRSAAIERSRLPSSQAQACRLQLRHENGSITIVARCCIERIFRFDKSDMKLRRLPGLVVFPACSPPWDPTLRSGVPKAPAGFIRLLTPVGRLRA